MTSWKPSTQRTTTELILDHPVPEWPPHPHTEQPPTTQRSTTAWWQTTTTTTTTTTTAWQPTTTRRPVTVTSATEDTRPSGAGPYPGDSCQGNQNFPFPGKCSSYLRWVTASQHLSFLSFLSFLTSLKDFKRVIFERNVGVQIFKKMVYIFLLTCLFK